MAKNCTQCFLGSTALSRDNMVNNCTPLCSWVHSRIQGQYVLGSIALSEDHMVKRFADTEESHDGMHSDSVCNWTFHVSAGGSIPSYTSNYFYLVGVGAMGQDSEEAGGRVVDSWVHNSRTVLLPQYMFLDPQPIPWPICSKTVAPILSWVNSPIQQQCG